MAATKTRKKPRTAKQIAATKKLVRLNKAKAKKGPKKAARKPARTAKKAARKPAKKAARKPAKKAAKKGARKAARSSAKLKRGPGYSALNTLTVCPAQAAALGSLMRSHMCKSRGKGRTVCLTKTGKVKAIITHGR
jgi:hypothetical protein